MGIMDRIREKFEMPPDAAAIASVAITPQPARTAPSAPCQCGCPLFWLSIYGDWHCLNCREYPDRSFVKARCDATDVASVESAGESGGEWSTHEYRSPRGSFTFHTKANPKTWVQRATDLSSLGCFVEILNQRQKTKEHKSHAT